MLPNPRRRRAGFSMIELLIVMVIMAIMFAMVSPRMTTIRDSSTLRAGRQQLSAAFSAGRAAALQKGRPSVVIIDGNEVTVRVLSGLNNTDVRVFGPLRLDASLGITLQRLGNAPDSVTYSARGLMSNAIAGDDQIFRYQLSHGSTADTLCISAVGLILPKGCTL